MSIWRARGLVGAHPRPLTPQTLAIFAGGLLLAAFVGIASAGGLPVS